VPFSEKEKDLTRLFCVRFTFECVIKRLKNWLKMAQNGSNLSKIRCKSSFFGARGDGFCQEKKPLEGIAYGTAILVVFEIPRGGGPLPEMCRRSSMNRKRRDEFKVAGCRVMICKSIYAIGLTVSDLEQSA
jgi:hypothetical protein